MRLVTDIQEFSHQKYSVYLDGEFAFVLYQGELSAYGLKKGGTIEEGSYKKIREEVLPKRAKKRCMNLLKSRPYTEKKLRDKLKEGKYPQESIEKAIEYVRSFGYIDDHEYACRYIECHKEKESRKRMEEKLMLKGINKEVLQAAFGEMYTDEEEDELQFAQAVRWLEKKGWNPDEAERKEKQKMYAFLLRKGIKVKVIRKILEERE